MSEVGRAKLEALKRPVEGERSRSFGERKGSRQGKGDVQRGQLDKDWQQPDVEMWRWLRESEGPGQVALGQGVREAVTWRQSGKDKRQQGLGVRGSCGCCRLHCVHRRRRVRRG